MVDKHYPFNKNKNLKEAIEEIITNFLYSNLTSKFDDKCILRLKKDIEKFLPEKYNYNIDMFDMTFSSFFKCFNVYVSYSKKPYTYTIRLSEIVRKRAIS